MSELFSCSWSSLQEGYKALTVIEDSVRGKFSTVCLRGPKVTRE